MSNEDLIKVYETELLKVIEESKQKAENPRTAILNSSYNNGRIFGLLKAIEIISIEDFMRIYEDVKPRIEELLDINEGIYDL